MRRLKPSEIRYSQDSINNHFNSNSHHRNVLIGETLDDLIEERISVADIPTITVEKRNDKWFTADNRRLWVFKCLEIFGKCDTILVKDTNYIPLVKMTTNNDGTSVRVRGIAGGRYQSFVETFDRLKAEKQTAEAKLNHTVAQLSDSQASQQQIERAYEQKLADNELIKTKLETKIDDLESKIRWLKSVLSHSETRQIRPTYQRQAALGSKTRRPKSVAKMSFDNEDYQRSSKALKVEKEANQELTQENETVVLIKKCELNIFKMENNALKTENYQLKESTKKLEKQLSDIRELVVNLYRVLKVE